MSYTMPSPTDATYIAQAVPDECDFTALSLQGVGNGVVSGLGASVVGFVVTIAPGEALYNAGAVVFAGGTITIAAASTWDRRDIVCLEPSGTLIVVEGTPCTAANWSLAHQKAQIAPPWKPDYPSNAVLLWEVYVPGAATTLSNNCLTDKRIAAQSNVQITSYGRTYAVSGQIQVAIGDVGFIPAFRVPVTPGQTVTLNRVEGVIRTGGTVTLEVTQNGSVISGLSSIAVNTTPAVTTLGTPVTVADLDAFAIVVTNVSGACYNLSFTLYFDTNY